MTDRQLGIVTWFDRVKGYGFIRPQNGDDVLVYSSELERSLPPLHEGQRVSFLIAVTRKIPEAHEVTVL